MTSPLVASISTRSGTITAAEIDADANLSHLSRLLSTDASAVLLGPVCSVVNVGTESVSELGITALSLLAKNVRSLEVFS